MITTSFSKSFTLDESFSQEPSESEEHYGSANSAYCNSYDTSSRKSSTIICWGNNSWIGVLEHLTIRDDIKIAISRGVLTELVPVTIVVTLIDVTSDGDPLGTDVGESVLEDEDGVDTGTEVLERVDREAGFCDVRDSNEVDEGVLIEVGLLEEDDEVEVVEDEVGEGLEEGVVDEVEDEVELDVEMDVDVLVGVEVVLEEVGDGEEEVDVLVRDDEELLEDVLVLLLTLELVAKVEELARLELVSLVELIVVDVDVELEVTEVDVALDEVEDSVEDEDGDEDEAGDEEVRDDEDDGDDVVLVRVAVEDDVTEESAVLLIRLLVLLVLSRLVLSMPPLLLLLVLLRGALLVPNSRVYHSLFSASSSNGRNKKEKSNCTSRGPQRRTRDC